MPTPLHGLKRDWDQLEGSFEERFDYINTHRDPINGSRPIPKGELKDLSVEVGVYGVLMNSPAPSAVTLRAFFADPDFTELPMDYPGVPSLLDQLFEEHEEMTEEAMVAMNELSGKTISEKHLGRQATYEDLERCGIMP